MAHIHNGILLSYFKKMKSYHLWKHEWFLEGIMLSEISQRKTTSIWSHLFVESKKQSKQTKQKQTHRYREQMGGCQRVWGMGKWNRWMGLRGTNLHLQNVSYEDVLYSVRNIVNNIVRTLYGDSWLLDLWWSFHNVCKCQITT